MNFTLRHGSRILYSGTSLAQLLSRMRPASDTNDALRFFSVCSGIEAASVAWAPLGWKCIGVAEIEKFPSAALAHHYPNVPNHGDFTKVDTSRLGRVDILCGGTPCQAFSVAGARQSLDDARGNLTLAFVGLAHELADGNGLRNVVWENVPGVLSTKDNAFGCFLAGLVGANESFVPVEPVPAAGKSNKRYGWSAKQRAHYIKWPRAGVVAGPKGRAAWTIKDAQYFGLAQRRERVLVVADFGNGADPAAVLFEPEGVRRDSPPRRETGQGTSHPIAPSLVSSGRGVERAGDTRGQDPVVAVQVAPTMRAGGNTSGGDRPYGTDVDTCDSLVAYAPPLARCVATREGQSLDFETTTMLAVGVAGPISHALAAEGADASEDGTGRGTPIVTYAPEIAGTMKACSGKSGTPNGAEELDRMVVQTVDLQNVALGKDVSYTLDTTRPDRGGGQAVLAFDCKASGQSGFGVGEIAGTMRAMGHATSHTNGGANNCGAVASAVRRLTPRECERLQGFQFLVHPTYPGAWQDHSGRWWSPDYTAIPWRGKPAALCPDGPRYKALGNSWAVPKFRWLGERIARLMPPY